MSKLDAFAEELEELLRKLNQGKYDIYLLGDFNINFLKYDSKPTEKYLDMLYSNNIIPVITKPTRLTVHTKTLIDHIYTNVPISNITTAVLVCWTYLTIFRYSVLQKSACKKTMQKCFTEITNILVKKHI
jgi:exonuclease III